MKRLTWIFTFLILPEYSFADYESMWLEASAGWQGYNVKAKMRDHKKGWAALFNNYAEQDSWIFDSHQDRTTGMGIEPEFKTIGVSRFISAPFKWGYADVGIGLAYGTGEWVENCESLGQTILGQRYACDLEETSTLGIPFHATAVFGKYAGMGVHLDLFVAPEVESQVQVGLTIPLGIFTK